MAEVDWDDVIQKADDSARSLLAEVLGKYADEITELVIIFHTQDGQQHGYNNVSTSAMMIAMLEVAKYQLIKKAAES